jgi:hypothetical protein
MCFCGLIDILTELSSKLMQSIVITTLAKHDSLMAEFVAMLVRFSEFLKNGKYIFSKSILLIKLRNSRISININNESLLLLEKIV